MAFGRHAGLALGETADFGVHEFAEAKGKTVCELIEDVPPVGVLCKDTAGNEFGQVLGNIGLGGPDDFHDVGDAAGDVTERLQDGEAKRIRQRAEELCDGRELSGGKGRFLA